MKASWIKIAAAAALGVMIAGGAQAQKGPGKGKHNKHAIAWSQAEGKPSFQPGRSVGFYVWHEGNTVYVVTTSESDKGVRFGGKIIAQDGSIADVRGMKDEKVDKIKQPKPNEVAFHFVTHEGTDGVKFTLNGGQRLRLALQQEGHKTEHIFYGARAIEAERDPVVFDLTR